MSKNSSLNLRIDSKLKERIKQECYERRISLTTAVETGLKMWLENDVNIGMMENSKNDVLLSKIDNLYREIEDLKNIVRYENKTYLITQEVLDIEYD
jgi:antitoxin component of RelBE/YafQ-DinJ toxin-antitoxin module